VHAKCAKCPLYTKGEEDDDRNMREAGLAAAKLVQAGSQTNGDPSGKDSSGVQIDVDSILKQPAK
jgi:hypothetical protein